MRSEVVGLLLKLADKKNTFDCTSLMDKDKQKLLEYLADKLGNCQPDDYCSVVQYIL